MNDTKKGTIKHAKPYAEAGANGLFASCIVNGSEISGVVQSAAMAINVMYMPSLADFKGLPKLGVKRISMGDLFFDKMSC